MENNKVTLNKEELLNILKEYYKKYWNADIYESREILNKENTINVYPYLHLSNYGDPLLIIILKTYYKDLGFNLLKEEDISFLRSSDGTLINAQIENLTKDNDLSR